MPLDEIEPVHFIQVKRDVVERPPIMRIRAVRHEQVGERHPDG